MYGLSIVKGGDEGTSRNIEVCSVEFIFLNYTHAPEKKKRILYYYLNILQRFFTGPLRVHGKRVGGFIIVVCVDILL